MAAPIALLGDNHEERLDTDGTGFERLADEDGKRRFSAIAYTGVDVSRTFGRMVVDVEGINVPSTMGMLLEHDDDRPVAVCTGHSKVGGRLKLGGHFLDGVASHDEAPALVARADQGWPLKMSIGIRFRRHSFYEDGVEFKVNGRTFKGPMVCVDESELFETSFIHVNPADLATEASVMRAEAREGKMADANKEPEKLAGQTREEILAEGRKLALAEIEAQRELDAALSDAFPDEKERKAAREKGTTLAQAKEAATVRYRNRVAELERAEAQRRQALENIERKSPQAGQPGADMRTIQVVQGPDEVRQALSTDERVGAELRRLPKLDEVFRGGREGLSAQQILQSWAKTRDRRSTRDGRPVLCDLGAKDGARVHPETLASLKRMARDVEDGLESARLDVGSSGPDYSRVTVNGFQGSFYESYEAQLSANWSAELSHQIPSDQQIEIVRWLGAPPMLQEWSGPRIAKSIPIYEQLLKAVKFEATLHVDRFDWDHQKFDKIAKAFGLFGAVAASHWDIRFTRLLEANPTAYDAVALFAATHTLGGDSGTIVNDYSSSGTGGTKGVAGTLAIAGALPTPLEWANIILQLTPKFRTFKWANGIRMHATARQWGVMVHPDVEGNAQAAISMERLDLGASNPLFSQRSQYKIIPNAYMSDPTIFYIFRLDTPNKALLRAEPDALEMMWQGPGSQMSFEEDKYAMGMRTVRSIAPGAFESVLRAQLGNS